MLSNDTSAIDWPSISVVIPLYNDMETLGDQLDALAAQHYDGRWEVIIADNGSTDGGPDRALEWRDRLPELRIVDASSRRGVNHARNLGALAAKGELILLCDADDVVSVGWLAAMAKASRTADVMGGAFDEDILNDETTRSWRYQRPIGELPTTLDFLPFAVGSNFGAKRSVFEEVGGWDESYFGGGDDVEFSWRAQLAGFTLAFVPDAIVQSRYRQTLDSLVRQFYLRGRAGPRLYRAFAGVGAKRRSLKATVWSWLRIVKHLPDAFGSISQRGKLFRKIAYALGRIHGSLEQRVLFL